MGKLKPIINTRSTGLKRLVVRKVISQKLDGILIDQKSLLFLMDHVTNDPAGQMTLSLHFNIF